MSTTSPAMLSLARRLLAGEPAGVESSRGQADQAVRACEKMRVPLTKLIGAAGFASLMSRALALAKRQAPSLEGLRVEADGTLSGLNDPQPDSGAPDAAQHTGPILLAELLGLLVTFIGQPLTLGLLREAWPDASLETMTPGTEGIL